MGLNFSIIQLVVVSVGYHHWCCPEDGSNLFPAISYYILFFFSMGLIHSYYLPTGCEGRTRKYKPEVFHTARACELFFKLLQFTGSHIVIETPIMYKLCKIPSYNLLYFVVFQWVWYILIIHIYQLGAGTVPGNTSLRFFIQPKLARAVWRNKGLYFQARHEHSVSK